MTHPLERRFYFNTSFSVSTPFSRNDNCHLIKIIKQFDWNTNEIMKSPQIYIYGRTITNEDGRITIQNYLTRLFDCEMFYMRWTEASYEITYLDKQELPFGEWML